MQPVIRLLPGGVATTRARPAAPAPAPDDKRTAIIDAARILFGRYGYRRTSIDDLAGAAGIAKGTVYLYFATKEEIFRALSQAAIAHVLREAERAAATAGPVVVRLRRILEAKFGYFFEVVHSSPHARELIDSKNRLSADLFTQADRAYLRILARAIAAATGRGELSLARVGLTPEAAAELVVCGAHGIGEVGEGPAPTARVFRRRLDDLVRVLAVGLGARTTAA